MSDRLVEVVQRTMEGLEPSERMLRRARRVRRRRALGATGGAAVAVVLGLVGVAVAAGDDDDASVAADRGSCTPTWQALAPTIVPHGMTATGAHRWAEGDAASITIGPEQPRVDPIGDATVLVAGHLRTIGATEDGDYAIVVPRGPGTQCGYSIVGVGVTVGELASFAIGLVRESGVGVWPFQADEQAQAERSRWSADAGDAALAFAADVLGWEGGIEVIESSITARRATVALQSPALDAEVALGMVDVDDGGWTVQSARMQPLDRDFALEVDRSPDGGGEVSLTIAPRRPPATVDVRVETRGGGAASTSRDGEAPDDTYGLSWGQGAPPGQYSMWSGPLRLVVLFRDEQGRVFDAFIERLSVGDSLVRND